jgi:hypothetical protein
MDQSRRKFFGIFAAASAVAAIPAGAVVAEKAADEAVGPMMFEHTCDGGASRLTPQRVAEVQKDYPWTYRGCGTKFRWYFGTTAICPNCGYHYLLTIEDVKSNFYKRVQ